MRIRAGLPTGVTALLFDEAAARRALEGSLAGTLARRGYREALLPILDYFDPYGPLLPSAAREQLYRFVDRDGQLLALRSDFTPMLARLLAPRLDAFELPLRLFYRGDVVRYQDGTAGRLREHSQLGAELLTAPGDDEAAKERADAELVELLLELLVSRTGAASADGSAPRATRLVLGLAGALVPLLRGARCPRDLARAIARRDRARARAESRALLEVVEHGFPSDPAELGVAAAGFARLERLATRLAETLAPSGATVSIDLAEFADEGLEQPSTSAPGSEPAAATTGRASYYDGIVFRAYLDGLGQPVASGGRYDALFRSLGARVCAAGFQIGLDLLLEAHQRSAAVERTATEAAAR